MPWKSIERLNRFQFENRIIPGDQFLFNGGEIFRGNLIITGSGNATNRVVIGSYGTGAAIFSGSYPVENWSDGPVRVASKVAPHYSDQISLLYVNGTKQYVARDPDLGDYFWFRDSNTSKTFRAWSNSSFTELKNFNESYLGSTVRARVSNINAIKTKVMSVNQTVVEIDDPIDRDIASYIEGFGVYFENKLFMMDQPNEWFYESGQLYYVPPAETNMNQLSILAQNITYGIQRGAVNSTSSISYVTIRDLEFRHYETGIAFDPVFNFDIINNTFFGCGIYAKNCTNCNILGNTVNDSDLWGIYLDQPTGNTISNNTLINTSMKMGYNQFVSGAINLYVPTSCVISNNKVSTCGSFGIIVDTGKNIQVYRNLVESSAQLLSGSAFHNFNSEGVNNQNISWVDNVGLNSGTSFGSRTEAYLVNQFTNSSEVSFLSYGMTVWENSNNVRVISNDFIGSTFPLSIYDSHNITLTDNMFYGRYGVSFSSLDGVVFHNNSVYLKDQAESNTILSSDEEVSGSFNFSQNTYCNLWNNDIFGIDLVYYNIDAWRRDHEPTAKLCSYLSLEEHYSQNLMPDFKNWILLPNSSGLEFISQLDDHRCPPEESCLKISYSYSSEYSILSAFQPNHGLEVGDAYQFKLSFTIWSDTLLTDTPLISISGAQSNFPYNYTTLSNYSKDFKVLEKSEPDFVPTYTATNHTFILNKVSDEGTFPIDIWFYISDVMTQGTYVLSGVSLTVVEPSLFPLVNPSDAPVTFNLNSTYSYCFEDGSSCPMSIVVPAWSSLMIYAVNQTFPMTTSAATTVTPTTSLTSATSATTSTTRASSSTSATLTSAASSTSSPFSLDKVSTKSGISRATLILAIIVPTAVVSIAIFVIIFVIFRIKKRKNSQRGQDDENQSSSVELKRATSIDENDPKKQKSIPKLTGVKLVTKLGSGNFGEVYRGTWNDTDIAVKKLLDVRDLKNFEKEMELLWRIGNHPCVVPFLGVFVTETDHYCMCFEFVKNGDLVKFLVKNQSNLQFDDLLDMMLSSAKGMQFLENSKIIHRDLACRNLLVSKIEDRYVAKISDFGLSRDMNDTDYQPSSNTMVPVRWSSPEVLLNREFSHKSDVWSFGVVMWEIVQYGATPFAGHSNVQVVGLVTSGTRLSRPEQNCSDELWSLICSCFKTEPKDRPSFSEIVKTLSAMNSNSSSHSKEENEKFGTMISEYAHATNGADEVEVYVA